MKCSVAVINGFCQDISKFLVEVVIGTDGSGREMEAAKGFFKELPISFVGNGPPYLSADVV